MPIRKFDKTYPKPDNYEEGVPTIYTRWGQNLMMFKIPDDAYDLYIRYSQWAADLTTSTESDYDNRDQLIITAGTLETYLALQEYIDAQVWAAKFIGQTN